MYRNYKQISYIYISPFVINYNYLDHGGGWGYSGRSIEAIRFMPNTDILLGGYGLFGGRDKYTAKIKVIRHISINDKIK